jgi:hypothetical protein
MGHVKFQTVAEGRGCMEWYPISLSETDTVKELIRHRMNYDTVFMSKEFYTYDAFTSNGVPEFREPIEVIYLDLDCLIEQCNFNQTQRYIIYRLMLKDTYQEIADDIEWTRDNVKNEFDRIARRIVNQNNYNWNTFIETAGYKKIEDIFRYKQCSKCGKWYQINNKNFRFDKFNAAFKTFCRQCESSAKN